MSTAASSLATPTTAPLTVKYNYAIGYLRAFIVALVVAHHAALAYHPNAPPPPATLHTDPPGGPPVAGDASAQMRGSR